MNLNLHKIIYSCFFFRFYNENVSKHFKPHYYRCSSRENYSFVEENRLQIISIKIDNEPVVAKVWQKIDRTTIFLAFSFSKKPKFHFHRNSKRGVFNNTKKLHEGAPRSSGFEGNRAINGQVDCNAKFRLNTI